MLDLLEAEPFTAENLAKLAALAPYDSEYLVVQERGGILKVTAVAQEANLFWLSNSVFSLRVVQAGHLEFFLGDSHLLTYRAGTITKPLQWPFAQGRAPIEHMARALVAMPDRDPLGLDDARDAISWTLHGVAGELMRRRHGGIFAVLDEDDNELALAGKRLREPLALAATTQESIDLSRAANSDDPGVQLAAIAASKQLEYENSVVGRLTTVDGAVVANARLDVLAFGVKLPSRSQKVPLVSRAVGGGGYEIMDFSGKGTRHKSAVAFVEEGKRRLALIASADGPAGAVFKNEEGAVIYWPLQQRYGVFDV